jgi:hypothetical protein
MKYNSLESEKPNKGGEIEKDYLSFDCHPVGFR